MSDGDIGSGGTAATSQGPKEPGQAANAEVRVSTFTGISYITSEINNIPTAMGTPTFRREVHGPTNYMTAPIRAIRTRCTRATATTRIAAGAVAPSRTGSNLCRCEHVRLGRASRRDVSCGHVRRQHASDQLLDQHRTSIRCCLTATTARTRRTPIFKLG